MTDPEEAGFATLGDWRAPGHRRGAIVLVRDGAGRVLLQLRDRRAGVAYAGYWAMFGGGVEAGETLRAAALRELAEETGLRPEPAALRPLARVISDAAPRGRLYVFGVDLDVAPGALRLREGAGFAFLDPVQFASLMIVPSQRLALERFAAARW